MPRAACLLLSCVLVAGCAAAETDDLTGRCANGACVDTGGGDSPSGEDTGLPSDARVDGGGLDGGTGDSSGGTDTGGSGVDTGLGVDTSGGVDTGGGGGDTGGSGTDTGAIDTGKVDTGIGVDASTGPITGGPCSSGAAGATAFRIRWVNSGGTATVSYEVTGLPDKSGFKVAAYSTSFGYTPAYSDMFLAVGGLDLSGTQFVDVDLSTIGLSSIKSATLSLYGRSFATTSSGSFLWNTFDGSGTSGSISNAAPYHWDSTDISSGLGPGKVHKLRIKPGPPSSALVINRIELCIET